MSFRRQNNTWRAAPLLALASLLTFGQGNADAAIFEVTNTSNGGAGSLRVAILNANANPGGDQIQFNIPGAGPHVIQPTDANLLPIITDTVAIEGITQPGSVVNTNPMGAPPTLGTNAIIQVVLDGSLVTGPGPGLHIRADACVVWGIGVQNFRGSGAGILIDGAIQTMIWGNFIGCDPGGFTSAGNRTGILVLDAPRNEIGGNLPHTRNLIAPGGATSDYAGIRIAGPQSIENKVVGNQIGTNRDGNAPLAGGTHGIGVQIAGGAGNNTVGDPLARNVISGQDTGIEIESAHNNLILRNFIGVNLNGEIDAPSVAIPNDDGIRIQNGSFNLIGGPNLTSNIIAYNNRGVVVLGPDSKGNTITENVVFRNEELGIDLAGDGVTANDRRDTDSGPNDRLNTPSIRSAGTDDGVVGTMIRGYFHGAPGKEILIETFRSRECDTYAGYGEGEVFLDGSFTTSTDAHGNAAFLHLVAPSAIGEVVTATATDLATGSTSEFSECRPVRDLPSIVVGPVILEEEGNGLSSLRVELRNDSNRVLQNLQALLIGAEPVAPWWLQPVDGTSNYGTLPPGGGSQGDGFVLDLSGQDGQSFLIVLVVSYQTLAAGSFVDEIPILVAVDTSGIHSELAEGASSLRLGIHPNPATNGTVFRFDLPTASPTGLDIYDIRGRRVRTLANRALEAGPQELLWDGRDDDGRPVVSGAYFCRLKACGTSRTERLTVVQ